MDTIDKKQEGVRDIVSIHKQQIETRLEILEVYDERFLKHDKEEKRLRELAHTLHDKLLGDMSTISQRINAMEH